MVKVSFIQEISNYMKIKWNNDKNNFLSSKEDHSILYRLTLKNEKTSVELYTKFIYRNFLKRFNRLFTLRKPTQINFVEGKSIYEVYALTTFDEIMIDNKQERISLLGLYYPFYSFTDQLYLIFMTNIFKRLEIRYIQ